jgi:acetyl esterase/lipase
MPLDFDSSDSNPPAGRVSGLSRRRLLAGMGLAAGLPALAFRVHAAGVEVVYGSHPRQRTDVYTLRQSGPSPCLLFVHGGAWSVGNKSSAEPKVAVFHQHGYAMAALNYRLHPEVTPHEQAEDLALALAQLHRRASEWGIDPGRFALMGHSAGAHLAALVGLNTAYLSQAGFPLASLKSVVLLDGAGYDVPRQIREGENARLYRRVFGQDLAVQQRLSPLTYATAQRAHWPAFQIHHVARRNSSRDQSNALAAAIGRSGGVAEVHAAQDENHLTINKGFGDSADPTTQKTFAFLQRHL